MASHSPKMTQELKVSLRNIVKEVIDDEQQTIQSLSQLCKQLQAKSLHWQLNLHQTRLTNSMIQTLQKQGYDATEYTIRPKIKYVEYDYYAEQHAIQQLNEPLIEDPLNIQVLQNVRKDLDYSWHSKETLKEIEKHNTIINSMLSSGGWNMEQHQLPNSIFQHNSKPDQQPRIVFLGGCFGSGKSHVIHHMKSKGKQPFDQLNFNIDFDNCFYNDPDRIKNFLIGGDGSDVTTIDTLPCNKLHKEACLVSELFTRYCLATSRSVIVDGSLQDADWHVLFFQWIRHQYPLCKIGLIYVSVDNFEIIKRRVQKRELQTGRSVNLDTLLRIWNKIPKSIEILSHHVDAFIEINNSY